MTLKKAAGALGIAIVLVVICATSYYLFELRELGYLDSAIGTMREFSGAAQRYASAHPQQGFPKSIEEMYAAGLINDTLRQGVKNRYRYTYIAKISKPDGRVMGYEVHGDPIGAWPKRWHFYCDATGVLRRNDATPADEHSPAI